jgi:hypothetical protein
MKALSKFTLVSLLALSSTLNANYCTQETLSQARAVKENGCVLSSFQTTEKGDCTVAYSNCTFKIFDPKQGAFVNHTAQNMKGTFPNDANITKVGIKTEYPSIFVNYYLGR